MAKRTNAQRLHAARVQPRHIEDEVLLRRDALLAARVAQHALGRRFGRSARTKTIRSRAR